MREGRPVRVVHVVHSFGIGGLENVIVQLINRLPPERFEHVVLALTTVSDFQHAGGKKAFGLAGFDPGAKPFSIGDKDADRAAVQALALELDALFRPGLDRLREL